MGMKGNQGCIVLLRMLWESCSKFSLSCNLSFKDQHITQCADAYQLLPNVSICSWRKKKKEEGEKDKNA